MHPAGPRSDYRSANSDDGPVGAPSHKKEIAVTGILICLASPKGGVGKSTHAAALGAGLVDRGKPVHFVDMDEQGTLEGWAASATEGVPDATYEYRDCAGFAIERVYPEMADLCDRDGIIIVDTPGSSEPEVIGALCAADLVLFPFALTTPDIAGLQIAQQAVHDGLVRLFGDNHSAETDNIFGLFMPDLHFMSADRRAELERLSDIIPLRRGLQRNPLIADWFALGLTPANAFALPPTGGGLGQTIDPHKLKRASDLIDGYVDEILETLNA